MVGYVVAHKPELKMKEYELYCSYYCGVCKSIGRRHGQLPRSVLSYDSAFLAVLLSSLEEGEETVTREHCLIHPIKKKNICRDNPAVDYAADVMILLAYHKLLDDIQDENKFSAKAMKQLFRSTYRKLETRYSQLCHVIAVELNALTKLEQEHCPSVDRTSDAFAAIMAAVFSEFDVDWMDERRRELLSAIGFHLGKWMYLIDALDDIEMNLTDGNYNPLIYRFDFRHGEEREEDFVERLLPQTEFLLFHYLGEMGKAYDLLELRKNKGIAENILYFGLYRKTEDILKKYKQKGKNR